jgi:NADH:ubiquinone oxidoreductase subunit 6 (subunit J)
LVANGLTLLTVGGLYLAYGAKPRGFIAAGVLIGAAVVLFCCLPLTDPYRRPKRRG